MLCIRECFQFVSIAAILKVDSRTVQVKSEKKKKNHNFTQKQPDKVKSASKRRIMFM